MYIFNKLISVLARQLLVCRAAAAHSIAVSYIFLDFIYFLFCFMCLSTLLVLGFYFLLNAVGA